MVMNKELKEFFENNPPSIELHFELMETYFNDMTIENYQKVVYCGFMLYNLKELKPLINKPKGEPKTKDFSFEDFISMFNEITGKNFRGDKKTERQFNARSNDFTKSDFDVTIRNAYIGMTKDYANYLTPEYITRDNKFNQWLNSSLNNGSDF